MHAALLVEIGYRSVNVTAGKLFDSLLELRLLLPYNLKQTCSMHPRLLHLPIGSACLYRLVLPLVTYQEHAVGALQPMQQLIHLLRARETRLVQDVKRLLSAVRLLAADQMTLQCA